MNIRNTQDMLNKARVGADLNVAATLGDGWNCRVCGKENKRKAKQCSFCLQVKYTK